MDTNIQKYMAFLLAAENESFTRASEILNYSQSGISRMIGDLENELGMVLFVRSRTKTMLTPDGSQILPYVRELISSFRNLENHINELKGLDVGVVRVGAFMSAASQWLPNMIKAFQEDYPNISFEVAEGDYNDVADMIRSGAIDLGFTIPEMAEGLNYELVESDRYIAIIPEDHPLADRDTFPISRVAEEPFLLIESDGQTHIRDILRSHGVSPDVRYRTIDDYFVMSMVENNLGIAILPELMVKKIGYRILIKPLDVEAHRDIILAYKDKSALPAAGKKFIEYLGSRHRSETR